MDLKSEYTPPTCSAAPILDGAISPCAMENPTFDSNANRLTDLNCPKAVDPIISMALKMMSFRMLVQLFKYKESKLYPFAFDSAIN